MKLKKLRALLLSALLLFSVLSGCGTTVVVVEGIKPTAPQPTAAPTIPEVSPTAEPAAVPDVNPAADGAVKTGLAIVPVLSSSKDASAEEDGLAQAYATVAAVTFSGDIVTSCYIDAVQCNVNFDTTGKITTDLSVTPQTKNQLGDAYGMIAASSIGKEWHEQAAGFCAYITGKTVSEVKGLAVDESGKAADVDLAATVTIHINEFQDLIAKAAQ